MRGKRGKSMRFGLALVVIFLLAGCATLGPTYQKVDMIPEESALVYVYRPKSFVGGGVSYTVHADGQTVTKLVNGGYYPYFSPPGEVEFWAKTESKSSVTLDVRAGETYFIKGTVGVGFLMGRPHLMQVDAATGQAEIAECKLIPSP